MNKNIKTLKTDFAEAFKHYKNKNFKNAEITCYKILSIDPNHLDSISLLGSISALNKNFDKAQEFMHKILKIDYQVYLLPLYDISYI